MPLSLMRSAPLWRQIQQTNFTRLDALCDFLQLEEAMRSQLLDRPDFALNLPRRLASKIGKSLLEDPIALQFLPFKSHSKKEELSQARATDCATSKPSTNRCSENSKAAFTLNPIEDESFQITPRLLQKYRGRVLLITTSACAMHCRYCFRQNYDYQPSGNWGPEMEWLHAHADIEEVILSGGDPLSLGNEALVALLHQLEAIPHLKRLRLHTRFPIGIPERLDLDFLQACKKLRFPLWVVLHINHAKELDEEVKSALKRWKEHGAILLNQSVLLKGVNDSVEVLEELSLALINQGIMPYYLHQLDRVQGSEAFEVPIAKGREWINELQTRLSGYGVPRFVQEIPGESSKTPL